MAAAALAEVAFAGLAGHVRGMTRRDAHPAADALGFDGLSQAGAGRKPVTADAPITVPRAEAPAESEMYRHVGVIGASRGRHATVTWAFWRRHGWLFAVMCVAVLVGALPHLLAACCAP